MYNSCNYNLHVVNVIRSTLTEEVLAVVFSESRSLICGTAVANLIENRSRNIWMV